MRWNRAFRWTWLGFMGLLAAASATRAADQWWDTSNASGLTPGSNLWDTSTAAWAMNSSPGTAVPVAWTNGNNAWFSAGASTATVNGVSANVVTIGSGANLFQSGTGPLALSGGISNNAGNTTQTILTPLALTANQSWFLAGNASMNCYGAVTGAYALSVGTIPNGILTLTNANNLLAGLAIRGGTVAAYNGGNVLGGPSSPLSLGLATGQLLTAQIALKSLSAGSCTASIGDLIVAGAGCVSFDHNNLATASNTLSGANLGRAGRGTLYVSASNPYTGLTDAHRLVFTGGTNTVNGMLGPWVVDGQSKRYVTIGANGLVDVTATVGQGGVWGPASNVVLTGDCSLGVGASANSIVVDTRNLAVGSGLVLSNTSGGFLFDNGGKITGNGTVSVGANEMVAYVTSGTGLLTPAIDGTGGLTVFGGGTLTLSNSMTYSGDTWINGATLNVYLDGAKTWSQPINGVGTLAKSGPGVLILNQTTNALGASVTANRGTLLLNGGLLTDWYPLAFGTGGTIVMTNACRVFANQGGLNYTYVGGSSNTVHVLGGTDGAGTVWDLNALGPVNRYVVIGNGGGTGNTVIVDGMGVAGSAVMTNLYQLGVGSGAAGWGNRVSITNGGRLFIANTANYNGISVGGGGHNNQFWVGGGDVPSLVSNITYYGFTIGGQGGSTAPGTNNIVTLGANAQVWSLVQFYGASNALNINAGATWTGVGSTLLGGTGNVITVDGGLMNVVSGSLTDGGGGTPKGCRIVVKNGGRVLWSGSSGLSFAGAAGDSNNTISVTSGGLWSRPSGNQDFTLGAAGGLNNHMVVNGGTATNVGRYFYVQGVSSGVTVTNGLFYNSAGSGTVIGNGSGTNDFLAVRNGGSVYFNGATLTVGSGTGTGNVVSVQAGGLLDVGALVVAAGAGNLIANDGGVYQFSAATPTITTNNGPGCITLNNGVISLRNVTAANVTNNWRGALAGIAFGGVNAFRLNNSTNGVAAPQNYWFDSGAGYGPTNYAGLEMISGGTAYTNGWVAIGTNGWVTFSNTTAVLWGAVTNYGAMRIFNSTVTFMRGLTLAEGASILCASNNGAITVYGTLVLPGSATVTVPELDRYATLTLFQATNVVGSVSGWSVSPGTHRPILAAPGVVSLVPSLPGTVLVVQ